MSHSLFTKHSYLESNITPFCLGGGLYGIKVVKNILHIDEDVTHIKEGCFSEEVIKHIQNSEETIDTICFHSNIYLMSHSITSTSIKNLVFLDGVRFNKECFYDLKSNRYHRYNVFINRDLVDAAELFKAFPKLNARDINDFDKHLEMNKYYDPNYISSNEVGHRFDTYESKTYKEDWLDFIKYDNHNNPFCFIELIVHKLELMINFFKSKPDYDDNNILKLKVSNMTNAFNIGKELLKVNSKEEKERLSKNFFDCLALNWFEW